MSEYERPKTANYTTPIDPDDHVMTVAEYLDNVDCGLFIDDDGMGDVARDGLVSEARMGDTGWPDWIRPSDRDRFIPEDATHVVWYNR
jgi:hypothetical protein